LLLASAIFWFLAVAQKLGVNILTASRTGEEFLPGNIVEIEVHNFMTYTHLKSRPGARLNLVIGPNGSGKSSLVCAIGIGLAGEPSVSTCQELSIGFDMMPLSFKQMKSNWCSVLFF